MADWNPEVNELFARAIELDTASARQAFLDNACQEDPDLRSAVDRMLQAHEAAGSFLNQPAAGLAPTIVSGADDTFDDSQGDIPLDFLTPSNKPGCLGTLNQYEIVDVVGRGGMGIVLRAFDSKLNRVVAIKAMVPELAANPMSVKRFLREARAAAAVSHEHVVTIHAIEEQERPPFIVMEYIDGKSLQEKADDCGAFALIEILRIGTQTAQGLAAAHAQGLVHRDIKPANILLENGIERVKLTDFGLARATDDVSFTQTGQIAGTPQYMSPEQAEGMPLDARSDLFSLGGVLYTLCTGRPPFRAETAIAMLRRVIEDQPRRIRELNSEIPEWLEAIIFQLLAKDPAARFQSAEEVAELLGRCLAHVQDPRSTPPPVNIPVLKHEEETAGSWIGGILGGVLVLLVIFGVKSLWYYATDSGTVVVDSDDPSLLVEFTGILNETSEGNKQKVTFNWSDRVEHVGSGRVNLESGRYAVSVGDRNGEFDVSPRRFTLGRRREIKIQIRRKRPTLARMKLERQLEGHTATVTAVDVSPDGHYALSASGWPDSDDSLRLWDVRRAQLVREFKGHDGAIVRAKFSPDGKRIIAGGTKRDAFVFDVETGDLVARLAGFKSDFRHGIALLPDGEHALIGEGVGSVHICRIETGEVVDTLKQPDDRVMDIAVSPDATRVLATSGDEVYVWDLQSKQRIGRFRQHDELIQSVAFSHDGSKAVSASIDKTVRVWDVETQEQIVVLRGHTAGVLCARFTPDDQAIVSSGHDHTIRTWDLATGRQMTETKDSRRSIWSFAVTPDGEFVFSGGGQRDHEDSFRIEDFSLRLWRRPGRVPTRAAARAKPDGWINLLAVAKLEPERAHGVWQQEGERLVLVKGEHAHLEIPLASEAFVYEVQSHFYRRVDGGSIKFWLPIPGGHTELSFNDWYKFSGIQYLDGKMLHERKDGPALWAGPKFATGERHHILARVQNVPGQVKLSLFLDGQPLFDWQGPASSIVHQNPKLDIRQPNCIGVGTGTSPGIVWETLEFRNCE